MAKEAKVIKKNCAHMLRESFNTKNPTATNTGWWKI